jgi:hypothetical protein
MSETNFTPGPWYVRDLRAAEMRRLGWTGPSIDRILITNKTGADIIRDEGDNCVVARIQFDNRTEELRDGNLADAHMIAAAPELYGALLEAKGLADMAVMADDEDGSPSEDQAILVKLRSRIDAALATARGQS